jgi:hypothetical protein
MPVSPSSVHENGASTPKGNTTPLHLGTRTLKEQCGASAPVMPSRNVFRWGRLCGSRPGALHGGLANQVSPSLAKEVRRVQNFSVVFLFFFENNHF